MDYEEQLSAAKFRAERDQARQENDRLKERIERTANERRTCEEDEEAAKWVREHGGLDAVKRRWECLSYYAVMPEGMEWLIEAWPRFEDDSPVRLLDEFERYGEESGVSAVTMYADGSFALNFRAYSKGERVNRPAPKVLDADGVEIRVGEMVYSTEDGGYFTVTRARSSCAARRSWRG